MTEDLEEKIYFEKSKQDGLIRKQWHLLASHTSNAVGGCVRCSVREKRDENVMETQYGSVLRDCLWFQGSRQSLAARSSRQSLIRRSTR